MTTETITEFETVEKKVSVSVCDECGKDVGPVDDEDTITVPVLANPKIEYDRGEIIRQIKCDLARNSWTGNQHRGPGEKVTIEPLDRGYSAREGWVKWDDLSRVIDRKLPPQEHAFRAEAEATRELCPGCATEHGFEVDEDGAVSAMTVHTINDESESEPDRDPHPLVKHRESNAYERLEELEDREFIMGALSMLAALVITFFGWSVPFIPFLAAALAFFICSFWTYPFHIQDP